MVIRGLEPAEPQGSAAPRFGMQAGKSTRGHGGPYTTGPSHESRPPPAEEHSPLLSG